MAKRPTIALCAIMKNEAHNLKGWFDSFNGLFDEIHITDTGSTDGSVELAKSLGITVHHFDWVNDFSAARNRSFEVTKCDYIMWADLDDQMMNREAFELWRDTVMGSYDYWVATYHYAWDETKSVPLCSFARERVIKNNIGLKWKYFVHEGIMPTSGMKGVRAAPITTWAVKHMRTKQDIEKDKGRNVGLFEKFNGNLDSRMKYYYGKELFESGKPVESCHWFAQAMTDHTLELHDRILGHQYWGYALMQCNQYDQAINLCHNAMSIAPERAELWCIIADCYIKKGLICEAIPHYNAAKTCRNLNSGKLAMAVFTFGDCYSLYPRTQLIKCYYQTGNIESAKAEMEEALKYHPNNGELLELKDKLYEESERLKISTDSKQTEDIVFTCVPTPMDFDPSIEKVKNMGGSETACIHMAYNLKKLTDRRVIVFNTRAKSEVFDGVEYMPQASAAEYFKENKPKMHVAWRHNMQVTDPAVTYLWCHDLIAHQLDAGKNYNKILALSNFHKGFLRGMMGIPESDIYVTRNGVKPENFRGLNFKDKISAKVIYSSSPDRGLEDVVRVMDKVVERIPHATLHVFYGTDNMRKMGMKDQADMYEALMYSRKYIKYHGGVQQKELMKHFAESEVWLYPTNFNETFCITALEALACKVYPVVRSYGALNDTLAEAKEKGMASIIDTEMNESGVEQFAIEVIDAINKNKWSGVGLDLGAHSWESVARDWIRDFLS